MCQQTMDTQICVTSQSTHYNKLTNLGDDMKTYKLIYKSSTGRTFIRPFKCKEHLEAYIDALKSLNDACGTQATFEVV